MKEKILDCVNYIKNISIQDESSFTKIETTIIDETNITVNNTQKNQNLGKLLRDIKSFRNSQESLESR